MFISKRAGAMRCAYCTLQEPPDLVASPFGKGRLRGILSQLDQETPEKSPPTPLWQRGESGGGRNSKRSPDAAQRNPGLCQQRVGRNNRRAFRRMLSVECSFPSAPVQCAALIAPYKSYKSRLISWLPPLGKGRLRGILSQLDQETPEKSPPPPFGKGGRAVVAGSASVARMQRSGIRGYASNA
jgi:hypothetical protein